VIAAHVLLALVSGALAGIPLALVAVALARAFPSAAARYAIVTAAFAAAAAEPIVAIVLSARHAPHANLALPLERTLAGAGSIDPIFAVIGAVTVVLLGDVAFALYRLLLVKRDACVDTGFEVGARRAPVARSGAVESATAIGYRRPCIVLPAGIEARVDAAELRAIIAHENAHLARYDDWAKAVQAIVVRTLWFAPALWILARRLDLERELASDERVAALVDPRAYAACLLRLAVDVPGRHVAPAAWRGRAQIAVRVEELLRPARRLGAGGAALRLAALAAAIVAGAFGAGGLVPAAGPSDVPAVARAPHLAPARTHAGSFALARRPVPTPVRPTVVVVQETVGPVLAPPLAVASLAMPSAPALPRQAGVARPRAVIATLPVRAEPTASASIAAGASAPCRGCAMLRRPVTDAPAVAVPRPAADPAEQPAPEPSGSPFAGVRGAPKEPNSSAPSWPGLLY